MCYYTTSIKRRERIMLVQQHQIGTTTSNNDLKLRWFMKTCWEKYMHCKYYNAQGHSQGQNERSQERRQIVGIKSCWVDLMRNKKLLWGCRKKWWKNKPNNDSRDTSIIGDYSKVRHKHCSYNGWHSSQQSEKNKGFLRLFFIAIILVIEFTICKTNVKAVTEHNSHQWVCWQAIQRREQDNICWN